KAGPSNSPLSFALTGAHALAVPSGSATLSLSFGAAQVPATIRASIASVWTGDRADVPTGPITRPSRRRMSDLGDAGPSPIARRLDTATSAAAMARCRNALGQVLLQRPTIYDSPA